MLAREFNCINVNQKLWKNIQILKYKRNHTSHLFKRRAIISARLVGLWEQKIQLLRTWKLNSYCLYINISLDWIHNVSNRYQKVSSGPPKIILPKYCYVFFLFWPVPNHSVFHNLADICRYYISTDIEIWEWN